MALAIVILMAVAVLTTHVPHGLFMNWTGQQRGEGFEFHLLVVAIAVALMILGAGSASIDGWLALRS